MGLDTTDRTRDIQIFIAVAEAGGVSAAARALGLSPSAVSRVIQRLETRLGVRLMIRTTRTIVLTPEGESYLQAVSRVIADLDEVEQTLGHFGAARGQLRVTASVAFGKLAILPMIPLFQAAYPAICVELGLSDRIVDLAGGAADVAIRVGAMPSSELIAKKLGESDRVIVASPSYLSRHGTPKTPEDLAEHNCVTFSFRPGPARWPFIREGIALLQPVSGLISVDSGDPMVQLAIGGHGIARVGRFHVADEIRSGQLVLLLEEFSAGETEEFHAVFIGGQNTPTRVRVFVDFMSSYFAGANGWSMPKHPTP